MIYLTCIIAYLAILAAIAVVKSREVKDQSDFAVAGRSLSPWMMVCTMLAVWIGTGSIVGNAEQTYESGMAAMLLPLGTLFGMILLSTIATRARNIEASTVPEIIERRFGPVPRNLAMVSLVIAYMVIVSYQFNAGGAVLEVIVGERAPTSVAVGDELSFRQLSKGQLRYEPESKLPGVLTIDLEALTSVEGSETWCTLTAEFASDAVPRTTESSAAFRDISIDGDATRRVAFDRELMDGDATIEISSIPERGRLVMVQPILTAKYATMIAAAFIITYAALAGLMSLAWMDLLTGTVIMVTMCVAFPIYWFQAGGWSGIEAGFVADNRESHLSLLGVYSPVTLINFILPVFLLVLGDANQYQRIFASRSGEGARTAVTMMIFIAFAIELLIIACAWIASSMTPDPENGKYILIYAARHYLVLPLGCLFMVTVVAIIISTADSFLHVPATSVVNDLYLTYIDPKAPQPRILWVSRLLVVVFGVIAYIVTMLFSETTGFFQKALYAFTIYGTSITPTLVAALVWERATKQGAIASICSGAIVTLLWNELAVVKDSLPEALRDLDAVLPAITISVSVLIGVSLFTRPTVPVKPSQE